MTFPTQVRQAAHAVLGGVQAASPDLLQSIHSAMPAGLPALPCAWVGDVAFEIAHDSSIRSWVGQAEVWIAFDTFDNEESQARADQAVGLVIDAFTDDPHWPGANTIGEPRGVRSDVAEFNGVSYPAMVVTLGRIQMREGRV